MLVNMFFEREMQRSKEALKKKTAQSTFLFLHKKRHQNQTSTPPLCFKPLGFGTTYRRLASDLLARKSNHATFAAFGITN